MDREKPILQKIKKVEEEIKEIKEINQELKNLCQEIKQSIIYIHYNTPERSPGWFGGDYKSYKFREEKLNL